MPTVCSCDQRLASPRGCDCAPIPRDASHTSTQLTRHNCIHSLNRCAAAIAALDAHDIRDSAVNVADAPAAPTSPLYLVAPIQ